jgi:uncharacterized protein
MRIFEPHIHMISQPRKRVGTFEDYFEHLLGYETARAKQFGVEHVCTLSLNPREANDVPLANDVLKILPQYLAKERVMGVGEIGFDDITAAETDALSKQLVLAKDLGLPALVHTPHRRKAEGTLRSIDVCREVGFPFDRLILDHATEESIRSIVDSGAWAGFTVYPNTKLTPERCVNMLSEYGVERMMVNSSADWGPSTALSVPQVLAEMRRRGFEHDAMQKLAFDNPYRFYDQTGRLSKLLRRPKS